LVRGAILLYRYTLSSLVGRTCRHLPTCSEYADEAIVRHGLWRGAWMGVARFWRCRPFGSSGFDPVPRTLSADAVWYLPWRCGRWRSGETSTRGVEQPTIESTEACMPKQRPAAELDKEFHFKQPGEDPEYDAWFKEQVQIGLDQLDRGEFIADEEMRVWLAEQEAALLKQIEDQKRKRSD
jgi:uncharacterized protein